MITDLKPLFSINFSHARVKETLCKIASQGPLRSVRSVNGGVR
jgi:hypothetical protein